MDMRNKDGINNLVGLIKKIMNLQRIIIMFRGSQKKKEKKEKKKGWKETKGSVDGNRT